MGREPARAEKRVEFREQCVTAWEGNDIITSKPDLFFPFFSLINSSLLSPLFCSSHLAVCCASRRFKQATKHHPPRLVSSRVTEKGGIGVKMKRDERDGESISPAAESL